MKQSMWRCSGQHWLNTAFVWSVAGLTIGLLGEMHATDYVEEVMEAPFSTANAYRLNFASQGAASALKSGAVSIELKGLDLAGIDPLAFGDTDESTISMASPALSK